jgi:PAS domain-containing protein
MRLDRPRMRGSSLLAPLRGWRRALGTLVIERDHARAQPQTDELDEQEIVDFARELARQLSVGIENIWLLEEILRQRRLLEDTFNSLVDLVAVLDKDLRVVQTNEAFAARVGLKRADVMHRAIGELVGAEGDVRREGLVFVRGELWQAQPADGEPLRPGDRVRVEGVDGLVLTVRHVPEPAAVS